MLKPQPYGGPGLVENYGASRHHLVGLDDSAVCCVGSNVSRDPTWNAMTTPPWYRICCRSTER